MKTLCLSHIKVALYITAIFAVSSITCSDRAGVDLPHGPTLKDAHHLPQGYVELPFDQLPKNGSNPASADRYYEPLDSDSIEMTEYRGQSYYQPVNMCHRCFTFIGTYAATGEDKYLERAEKYAVRLMSLCTIVDSLPFAPYTIRYAVHSDSSITFEPPWYSGMAQGELTGMYVRLFELTHKDEYLTFARRLFETLLRLRHNNETWVARIDSAGYYWIEEYPHNRRPGRTLNGFVSAVYGVYDYYRVTRDKRALVIYELSLTTLKHYLPQYRIPGQASLYCLGHRKSASRGYHALHVNQMMQLHEMTGDEFFSLMADVFEADGKAAFSD